LTRGFLYPEGYHVVFLGFWVRFSFECL
jgi:hypothetical protein